MKLLRFCFVSKNLTWILFTMYLVCASAAAVSLGKEHRKVLKVLLAWNGCIGGWCAVQVTYL